MLKKLLLATALITASYSGAYAQISAMTYDPNPTVTDMVPTVHVACAGQPGCNYRINLGYVLGAAFSTNAQLETIVGNPTGISSYYLGGTTFPQPNLARLINGHLQLYGENGAWGTQTSLLSMTMNYPMQNNGGMGNFWDPTYRTVYSGQDAALEFVLMQSRLPVVTAASATFGTNNIVTPQGIRTVYTVVLATPLTSAQISQIASLPPNIRIETNNNFFGYTIPTGYSNSSGVPVLPVSVDGKTITVDNWTRATPYSVVASSVGAIPSNYDTGPYTVSIDVTHQIDLSYGGWHVQAADLVNTAFGSERVYTNDKTSQPALNLYDPLTSNQLFAGDYDSVTTNNPGTGSGIGVANHLCSSGWQACFVARNVQTSTSGNTIGFLCPTVGPIICMQSTQGSGYVLIVQPNATGPNTILLDTLGNLNLSGNISVQGQLGTAKNVVATGTVRTGTLTLSALNTAYPCNTSILGAHFYITDGRKPSETTGNGSGVPADCTPTTKGGSPVWVSVYDHVAVVN